MKESNLPEPISAYRRRLRRFEVPEKAPFGRLLKGQQRQVTLGLALASRPDLLILDDPTLGLDAVARRSIYDELIDELAARATTVFLTSHDLEGVDGLADRVGVLQRGRMLVDEPLEGLKRRFRRIRVPASGARPAWLDVMRPLPTSSGTWGEEVVVAGYDEVAAGSAAGPGAAAAEALSLEEISVALVGESEPEACR